MKKPKGGRYTPKAEKIAARPADSPIGAPVGAINGYYCELCHGYIFVIHVHEGVTPMFLVCRATEGCNGKMASMMYPTHIRVPLGVDTEIRWEWYMPDATALKRYKRRSPEVYEHCSKGGLLIRPITDDNVSSVGTHTTED